MFLVDVGQLFRCAGHHFMCVTTGPPIRGDPIRHSQAHIPLKPLPPCSRPLPRSNQRYGVSYGRAQEPTPGSAVKHCRFLDTGGGGTRAATRAPPPPRFWRTAINGRVPNIGMPRRVCSLPWSPPLGMRPCATSGGVVCESPTTGTTGTWLVVPPRTIASFVPCEGNTLPPQVLVVVHQWEGFPGGGLSGQYLCHRI